MDAWDVQRLVRRRLRWTRIVSLVGIIVMAGMIWFGVAYAITAIARGEVW